MFKTSNIPLSNVSSIIKTVSNSFKELLITFSTPQKVQMCMLELKFKMSGMKLKHLLPLISKVVYNFGFLIERYERYEHIQYIQNIKQIRLGMRATFPKELK